MECRLCSSSVALMDTFLSSSGEYLRKVIYLGVGVEILRDDLVSKSICKQCLSMIVNLHLFRIQALRNDKLLKVKAGLKTDTISINYKELVLQQNMIRNDISDITYSSTSHHLNNIKLITPPKTLLPEKRIGITAAKIINAYPNIKLPYSAINKNLCPTVSLEKIEIEGFENKTRKRGRKRKIKYDICELKPKKPYRYNPKNVLRINTRASASFKSLKKLDLPELMPNEPNLKQALFMSSLELLCKNAIVQPTSLEKNTTSVETQVNEAVFLPSKNRKVFAKTSDQFAKQPSYLAPGVPKLQVTKTKDSTKTLNILQNVNVIPQNINAINSLSVRTGEVPSTLGQESPIFEDDMYDEMGVDADDDNISTTSNNELPMETSLLMVGENSDSVHLCNICNRMFDTKRKLILHTKRHNKCSYCKVRCKDFASLQKHIETTCTITDLRKELVLCLVRCDEDPALIEKYASAYKSTADQAAETYIIKNTLHSNESIKMTFKKPKLAVATNTLDTTISEENSIGSQTNAEFNCMMNASMSNSSPTLSDSVLVENVVCISDDEDVNNVVFSTPEEKEEILLIFRKHIHMLKETKDAVTQAYFPSPNFQPIVTDKSVIFEDMYRDLKTGQIPVNVITTTDFRKPQAEVVFYMQNTTKPKGVYDWSAIKPHSIKPVGSRENKQKPLPPLTKIPTKHNMYRPSTSGISSNVLQNSSTGNMPLNSPPPYPFNGNYSTQQNFSHLAPTPSVSAVITNATSKIGKLRVKAPWELNNI